MALIVSEMCPPSELMHFKGNIFMFGATPTIPIPLALAANIPETQVP
jgi:hypothetical protein